MADSDSRESRLQALVAALIHRFNNVLMGIQPHVEVIKRAGKDNERVLGSATQIETALRRAKTVIADVGRLARPASIDVQPLDVDAWFETLRRDLRPFATGPVNLSFDSGVENLMMSGDREQLTRAIASLVTNAVEAMPDGGTVSVTARSVDSGVELRIADDGQGIAPEILERVFEPLFTTKRNSTGMGLSIVQQIVEAHGGAMHLESKAGQGTTVTFVVRRYP
ncbi:MAG: hypothetical protein NVSMB68_06790 [Thermoanaerobaculia bacterium]